VVGRSAANDEEGRVEYGDRTARCSWKGGHAKRRGFGSNTGDIHAEITLVDGAFRLERDGTLTPNPLMSRAEMRQVG
jgi:hypothetical protein